MRLQNKKNRIVNKNGRDNKNNFVSMEKND